VNISLLEELFTGCVSIYV